jgi:hypothetical protein
LHLIHFFCNISFSLIAFSFSVLSLSNLRCNNGSGSEGRSGRPVDSPAAAAGVLSTAETSFTSAYESSMASSASVRAARPLPGRLAAPPPPLTFGLVGILDYQFKKKMF